MDLLLLTFLSAEPVNHSFNDHVSPRRVRDTISPMKPFLNTRKRLRKAKDTAIDKWYMF